MKKEIIQDYIHSKSLPKLGLSSRSYEFTIQRCLKHFDKGKHISKINTGRDSQLQQPTI